MFLMFNCPIDGDSSGVNSIPSSNQRSPDVENSIGSSEANRARVEKESQEESFLAPNSSRLLSLKVEIADEPATEEDINPPSAINSSELETEADAEVSKDTTTVTQNKPDSSSIKENASPNVNASAGIGPVESNGGVELTPKLLLEILQHSIIGQDIIARASKGVLSDGRQLELAQIIAEWHLEHRKKLYEDNLKSYAKTITLLFRNEKLESYYLPKGGDKKNPGGKIYNKVNTIKSKLRKREKCEAIHLMTLWLMKLGDG
ncbi:uncharacterized protein LOC134205928 [Armigeres subalbatus]|uniref:uncharacterized protein LOC134205928 n=1 Tax=Armigeres subalbatus TaxID=124917 RepID=UPI002ED4A6ED